jgi:hypothetical protein
MRCRCGSKDIEFLITINHVDIYYCDVCQRDFSSSIDLVTPETKLMDQYGE